VRAAVEGRPGLPVNRRAEDEVAEPGLVLQRDERHALGCGWALQDDQLPRHRHRRAGRGIGERRLPPLERPVARTVVMAGGSGFYRDETGTRAPASSGELRIRLDNGDLLILGHLRAITVRVGQRLAPDTPVGRSGTANGTHVHIEVGVVDRALPSGYRIVEPRTYLRYNSQVTNATTDTTSSPVRR
jgi:hypothetical protein